MPIAINTTVIHRLQEQKSVYTADCDRFLSFGANRSAKLELWIEPNPNWTLKFQTELEQKPITLKRTNLAYLRSFRQNSNQT